MNSPICSANNKNIFLQVKLIEHARYSYGWKNIGHPMLENIPQQSRGISNLVGHSRHRIKMGIPMQSLSSGAIPKMALIRST